MVGVATIPRARLGDEPLSIRRGENHAWTITSGTAPFQAIFEVTKARAKRILERAKDQLALASPDGRTRLRNQPPPTGPLTFKIEAPGKPPVEIRGLYVMSNQPTADRNTTGLLVSDCRWLAQRVHVERSYNVRRTTGEYRLLQGEVTPHQVAPRVADFGYRRATLREGIPWTARQILEDVLTEVFGAAGFVMPGKIPFEDSVEGLVLHEPGDEAIARVLAFLPGLSIFPGLDGRIVVYNTLDKSEEAAIARMPRLLAGGWARVDRSLLRPAFVRAYSIRELELRFDYFEGDTRTVVVGREPRSLENVLPCPDVTLTLVSGHTVAAGTWITFDEFIEALVLKNDYPGGENSVFPGGAGLGPLTQSLIRRFYMAGHTNLMAVFAAVEGAGEINKLWARRIAAVQEHWRRTFRVLPQWVDKVRSFKARRVAITDQENGTRARADAYFDHIVKLSNKGLATLARNNDLGWPVNGWAEDLANAEVSPADVEVLDEDVGIIQITPKPDPGGLVAAYAPGALDVSMPKITPGDATVLWGQVSLSATFKLATVISAIQDVPNNEGRLHCEVVAAADAVKLLGVESAGECRGPDWEVAAGDDTARYAWVDGRKGEIEEAVFAGAEPPNDLMINRDTIRDVAVAQAARVYAYLLDRAEGSFTVSLTPDVVPTGSLQQVTYGVRYDGRKTITYTTSVLPPIVLAPSVQALLPESTRKVLRRMVQT